MKLSIITITFNNLDGLKHTAESIHWQTWKDYEWIVIDGGSTDGTREYLESLEPKPDYWVSEKDNGVYDAQNKGTLLSKGEYGIYMNAGDTFYDRDVLEKVFSQEHKADVLYGDWVQEHENKNILKIKAPDHIVFPFFQKDNICHQAIFVKMSIIKQLPYDISYKLYADWAKWTELSYKGYTFEYIPIIICKFLMGGLCCQSEENNKKEKTKLDEEFYHGSLMNLAEEYHELKHSNSDLAFQNSQMNEVLRQQETTIQQLNEEIKEKNNCINNLSSGLLEREHAISNLNKANQTLIELLGLKTKKAKRHLKTIRLLILLSSILLVLSITFTTLLFIK